MEFDTTILIVTEKARIKRSFGTYDSTSIYYNDALDAVLDETRKFVNAQCTVCIGYVRRMTEDGRKILPGEFYARITDVYDACDVAYISVYSGVEAVCNETYIKLFKGTEVEFAKKFGGRPDIIINDDISNKACEFYQKTRHARALHRRNEDTRAEQISMARRIVRQHAINVKYFDGLDKAVELADAKFRKNYRNEFVEYYQMDIGNQYGSEEFSSACIGWTAEQNKHYIDVMHNIVYSSICGKTCHMEDDPADRWMYNNGYKW